MPLPRALCTIVSRAPGTIVSRAPGRPGPAGRRRSFRQGAACRAPGRDWATLCVVLPAEGQPGGDRPAAARIRRRDRHGRGLRGPLAPVGSPLYRTRSERFDDLVLQAVSQLEPRWEAELAQVEFAVEEVPPADVPESEPEPVPLGRVEPGVPGTSDPERPARPARIVLYRRPLLARADSEDELGELVLDVVVEQFAKLLGVDPQTVDPEYPEDD